ncbi:hypothetical protein PHYSODRAFT_324195 [Phytophthora sojae]|uniref:Uncharacterized protein n=1 Tax=Phytophthora sojae (strain P6497) TaxID=1094619 RepID=G4YRG9_PHYSP|nr:hypothetical protein PHYSODRAFT_324195 [Phytophthora sojae]EGZ22903.1 hypothetical protein PHYSODRAFT_324195 [Phytophthora sojae]|eukprot:XP_009518191.1 hypothetical protein PHYSODRAFT_324195 [Phytophthora sojae]
MVSLYLGGPHPALRNLLQAATTAAAVCWAKIWGGAMNEQSLERVVATYERRTFAIFGANSRQSEPGPARAEKPSGAGL